MHTRKMNALLLHLLCIRHRFSSRDCYSEDDMPLFFHEVDLRRNKGFCSYVVENMIHSCFLHPRLVHRTFQPCWMNHHHAYPPILWMIGGSGRTICPLVFQSMNHRKWWTNRLPQLYVHQGALAKLSVSLNFLKSVSRGNRTRGHQYAERPM